MFRLYNVYADLGQNKTSHRGLSVFPLRCYCYILMCLPTYSSLHKTYYTSVSYFEKYFLCDFYHK